MIPSSSISFGKDCITVHNSIVKEVLLPGKDVRVGSQIVGNNSTHQRLRSSGNASPLKTFSFNTDSGKKAAGNATAHSLSSSIGAFIEGQYGGDGVAVYGLSIMDGYHAMTLTYGDNGKGGNEFNLYDQGPGTSFLSGNASFGSAAELDEHINSYVRDRQDKRVGASNQYEYPANAAVYQIYKPEDTSE